MYGRNSTKLLKLLPQKNNVMNKTININLGSTFFYVNESAYALLNIYLGRLEEAFNKTVGKDDILSDIEVRIAELFQERKKHVDYVINDEDVTKVIAILGQPEDFILEEDDDNFETGKQSSERELFRDPDNKYIGGVTSGLGYYFGVDASLIRISSILLALFSFGLFGFIYLLFWILIPIAITTADKLKMKGEPVNIDTIQKKIKKEFDEVSIKLKEVDYQKTTYILKKKINRFFNFLERLLSLIPNVIIKLVGLLFVIISVFGIFSILIGSVVFLIFGTQQWPFNFYFNFFDFNLLPSIYLSATIFLMVIIPFIFIFSLGVRLVYSRASTLGTVGRFVLFLLWIIAFISLLAIGTNELRNQSVTAIKIEKKELLVASKDTLTLKMNSIVKGKENQSWEFDRSTVINGPFDKRWGIGENLKIYVKQGGLEPSYLELKYTANGVNHQQAQKNVEKIMYEWQQDEKVLAIDPLWKLDTKANFYNQKLSLNIFLQEGQVLFIDNAIEYMIYFTLDNNQDFQRMEMGGHYWKILDGKLNCLDCKESKTQLNIQYKDEKGKENIRLNTDNQGITVKRK